MFLNYPNLDILNKNHKNPTTLRLQTAHFGEQSFLNFPILSKVLSQLHIWLPPLLNQITNRRSPLNNYKQLPKQ